MKVCILGNQARAMSNFWSTLLLRLVEAGHDVVCLLPQTEGGAEDLWEEELLRLGVRLVHYPLDRKGLNPVRDTRTLWSLYNIFTAEKPDVLFAFTIKPVIYGAIASFIAKAPERESRFVMITGLGYMFEGNTPVKKVLLHVARGLYRLALSCVGTVYFQNEEDRLLFDKLSIIPRDIAVRMSKGTGVDLQKFSPAPAPDGVPMFLYVGRLLEAKGLRELAQAARLVKKEYPDIRICLLGPEEFGPGAVPLEEVFTWQEEGILEYLGTTKDVRPYLALASVVVLPSWREGTPASLLEAMSVGRPLIATDVPGCREVVRDGENGLLVPKADVEALASAMKQLIVNPALRLAMGEAGRLLAEREFSAESVAQVLMHDMGLFLPAGVDGDRL